MAANPKLFRELSEPFASNTAADAAIEAFFKDLGEIREKHRLANVHCVIAGSMLADGEEQEFMTSVHYGDSMKAQCMAAWDYGRESAEHDALMKQVLSSAMKRVKDR